MRTNDMDPSLSADENEENGDDVGAGKALAPEEEDVLLLSDEDGTVNPSVAKESMNGSKGQEEEEDDDDDDVVEVPEEYDEEEGGPIVQNGEDGFDVHDVSDDEDDSNGLVIAKVQGGVNLNTQDDDVLLISDDENNSNSVNEAKNGDDHDDDVMEVEDENPDPLYGYEQGVSGDDDSRDILHKSKPQENGGGGDSEIGEVTDSDSKSSNTNNTIVVNDTKSLVDLANSKKEPGKEPTLVIIDTNAIMAGRGAVPMNKPNLHHQSGGIVGQLQGKVGGNRPPATGGSSSGGGSLTSIDIPDDAYLIEAPSFIVPYVFEQNGEQSLKETIKSLANKVKEIREEKIAKGEELTDEDKIAEPRKYNADDYFESPVGKLLTNIGMNLVQEFVQCDLLKMQKRQGEKEKAKNRMGMMTHLTQQSIISLKKNIDESKENNEPFKAKMKKCELCNFRTESELVMSTHQETPHMKNYSYRCNFCIYTTRAPHEIIFHMEAEHAVRARLERAPAYHQCPSCPFEDNSKAKLTRHLLGCAKRFVTAKNLDPPSDWDTPAKLPKLSKNRVLPHGINPAFLAPGGQRSMAAFNSMLPKQLQAQGLSMKGNLPPLLQAAPKNKPIPGLIRTNNPRGIQNPVINPQLQRGMMMRGGQMQHQMNNNHMLQQVVSGQLLGIGQGAASGFLTKLGLQPPAAVAPNASMQKGGSAQMRGVGRPSSQPSISITPLPRQGAGNPSTSATSQQQKAQGQGQGGKTSFVICEICDGYIKDLDQLRNHMQWIHKVKIHPKMIYNKPPLNCQKCQFRFFTDQGLERHLLGSHGLVTSSMQDAANKGQDSGRCPLCGKVYQWKLLAHVAKDHNVTLKPAHLSYKCTVCTATFGMYKLFESHVYSAHSVTKNARPERRPGLPQVSGKMGLQVTPRTMPMNNQGNSYKPLKINDEITIIPQPMANSGMQRNKGSLTITPQPMRRSLPVRNEDDGVQIIEIDDAPHKNGRQNGELRNRFPMMSETLRKRNLEISLCDSESPEDARGPPVKRIRQN